MKILAVDPYRIREPLFEGFRVILNFLGETYSPAYIQGISGAAFRTAGIFPCAPTCSSMMDTCGLIHLMGYEMKVFGIDENPGDLIGPMISAVRDGIDNGRPALVWHAFTNAEWDVVCGYDEAQKIFLGRGSYRGTDELAAERWDRAKDAVDISPAFGAILIGEKVLAFDAQTAEVAAIKEAVRHGRDYREPNPDGRWTMYQGIQCYRRWADEFSAPGKSREAGDAYCSGIYGATHRAAADFLSEIAGGYDPASDLLLEAAALFEKESSLLKKAEDLLGWNSPWGVDEKRSAGAAVILDQCARAYEGAIECLERALELI
ncbi:MAG: hypothetical protein PHZ09_11480 [Eubacteriales bacterium]|nr:hypothetical protein [Eubacteriales bacterium]